jgi:hypothetical protein
MYDTISGLDDNDDSEWDDVNGDGWDDGHRDDMEYRYGPSGASCWDYEDDF